MQAEGRQSTGGGNENFCSQKNFVILREGYHRLHVRYCILNRIADVHANFVVMRPDFVKRCHPTVEINALL